MNTIIYSIMFALQNDNSKVVDELLNFTGKKEKFEAIKEASLNDPECMLDMYNRKQAWNIGLTGKSMIQYGEDAEADSIYDNAIAIRKEVEEALKTMNRIQLTRFNKKLAAM